MLDRQSFATSWVVIERRPRFETVPVYPALFFVAWIVTVYTNSATSLHALGRPLFAGLVIVVVFQVAFSAIARNRHIGATLVMILFTSLVGLPTVALILCASLIGLTAFGIVRRT